MQADTSAPGEPQDPTVTPDPVPGAESASEETPPSAGRGRHAASRTGDGASATLLAERQQAAFDISGRPSTGGATNAAPGAMQPSGPPATPGPPGLAGATQTLGAGGTTPALGTAQTLGTTQTLGTAHAPGTTQPRSATQTLEPAATVPSSGQPEDVAAGAPAPSARSAARSAPRQARPRRVSLDVVRGMMCVFILVVDAWYTMPEWWDHAAWYGVHGQDLVFPFFIAVSGIGLGFASSGGVRVWSTLNRFVVLFIVGLLYNLQESFMFSGELNFDTLRVTGVLQAFGVVSVVIALLHYVLRTWWAWLIGTCVMAGVQLLILYVVASGCPDGALTLKCNPGFSLDKAVFGLAHMYNQGMDGHDPEGLWAMFGMVITASVGVTVAHALGLVPSRPFFSVETGRRFARALLCLAVFAAFAWGASQVTITMKKLWTTPFALGTGVALVFIWVILTVLLDHGRWALFITVMTYPLVALGRNALLVYFGDQMLLRSMFLSYPQGSDTSWAMTLAHDLGATDDNSTRFIIFMVASWTVLAIFLHRRKLYIRP